MTEPERPQPPQGRLVARRVLALAGAAVLLGGGAVAAWIVLRSAGSSGAQRAATTAVVRQPKPFRVVFPEGFTRAQMADRVAAVAGIAHRERPQATIVLSKQGYLRQSVARAVPGFGKQKRPLEGFLFPATYDFLPKTTAAQLVAAQIAAFRRTFGTLDLSYARKKDLTPYDVLIIASMIEREAVVPSERAKIAAVIYNRLHARMPLGIDATIRYGLRVPATASLRQSQLESDNPYNTRTHLGLPPTPIANPGLASLRAAAHPAKVDYLYFVRKPDHRHHYFTRDFNDFVNHEKAYGY
jgi:UPF0755 protein